MSPSWHGDGFYIKTTLHTEAELFQPLGFDYRNSRPSSEAGLNHNQGTFLLWTKRGHFCCGMTISPAFIDCLPFRHSILTHDWQFISFPQPQWVEIFTRSRRRAPRVKTPQLPNPPNHHSMPNIAARTARKMCRPRKTTMDCAAWNLT